MLFINSLVNAPYLHLLQDLMLTCLLLLRVHAMLGNLTLITRIRMPRYTLAIPLSSPHLCAWISRLPLVVCMLTLDTTLYHTLCKCIALSLWLYAPTLPSMPWHNRPPPGKHHILSCALRGGRRCSWPRSRIPCKRYVDVQQWNSIRRLQPFTAMPIHLAYPRYPTPLAHTQHWTLDIMVVAITLHNNITRNIAACTQAARRRA